MAAFGTEVRALGVGSDPDDGNHVSAPLEGRAAVVVTGDRQLLALRQHQGIRIVDPGTFRDVLDSPARGGEAPW